LPSPQPTSNLVPVTEVYDPVGREIEHRTYEYNRRGWQVAGVAGGILLLSVWLNVYQAAHPTPTRYVRIDEMGRAQPIAYSDLSYRPEPPEVRYFLNQWAQYSYARQRETVATTYRKRFYFMSHDLIQKVQAADRRSQEIEGVKSGKLDSNTLDVTSIQITSLNQHPGQDIVADGQAEIRFVKHFYSQGNAAGFLQAWRAAVHFVIAPGVQPKIAPELLPEYQRLNPLGFVITYLDEVPEGQLTREAKQ
jgi:type IV secretion system protein VirB5